MQKPWMQDCEGMQGSIPRFKQVWATALRPSSARVQHSPLPTEVPSLDSHQVARGSLYLFLFVSFVLLNGNLRTEVEESSQVTVPVEVEFLPRECSWRWSFDGVGWITAIPR
jgi:hypothetical protein